MLTTRGLTFRVGGTALVDDINLEIAAGECMAIIGPNGAGKSTLLRLLAGELEPTAGEIFYDGQPLAAMGRMERARRRGILPQSSTLTFEFLVLEVVMLGRMPHAARGNNSRDTEVALRALQAVDAAHLTERKYTTLSGGERQRVHLARVLAQIWDPPAQGGRVLLLDEPTSALDLGHQHMALKVARTWARRGVTVVIVLHDLNLAARYADRILLMHHGHKHCHGTPEEVLAPETIAQVFGLPVWVLPGPCNSGPVVVPCSDDFDSDQTHERGHSHDYTASERTGSA
jgi:iron complex transport system ATP-binding protein